MTNRAARSCILAVVFVVGCAHGEGGTCQVDGDCKEGLICCKDQSGATPVDWGVCLTRAECEAPEDATTDGDVTEDTDGDVTEDTDGDVTDTNGDVEPETTDATVEDTVEDTVVEDTVIEDTVIEDTVVEDTVIDDVVSEDAAGEDASGSG